MADEAAVLAYSHGNAALVDLTNVTNTAKVNTTVLGYVGNAMTAIAGPNFDNAGGGNYWINLALSAP